MAMDSRGAPDSAPKDVVEAWYSEIELMPNCIS